MKRWDVRFLLCMSLLAVAAWAQDKGSANTITKVEVRGTIVEIIGSKKPTFTSFTMTEPARLVIDISEAVFSGVPEQIPGAGTVSWIKTATYGSDASAIARVLVAFSKEVETDLTSVGNKLVIRILDGAPAAVARAEKPAATPKQAKEAEAPPQLQLASPTGSSNVAMDEQAARKKQEARDKEAAATAERDRVAKEKAEKEAAKRAEQWRLEEARQAEAEKKRLAEEERKHQAEQDRLAEQQRRTQAEEAKRESATEQKRKAEEERLAREQAKAEAENAQRAAAAEQKRKVEEERVARAKEAADAAAAKRQAAAEVAEAKLQAAAERKRKAEEERLAQQKARQDAAEAKRQAVAERKRKLEEERLAKEKARQDALAAKREAKLASRSVPAEPQYPSKRATMTFVGFERAGAGRVYVRTTGPVRYSVQQDGDKKVVLELENTRIAMRNNRRPLDTSFFDTAVAMVAPTPSGNRTVRVEIKLKETVPFQAKQDGNEVSVEFSRSAK